MFVGAGERKCENSLADKTLNSKRGKGNTAQKWGFLCSVHIYKETFFLCLFIQMTAYQAFSAESHKLMYEITKGAVFFNNREFINYSKAERDFISERSISAVACRMVSKLRRKRI